MQICQRCQKSRRFKETIERDKRNKKKRWKITSCMVCNFHINIEEYRSGKDDNEDD